MRYLFFLIFPVFLFSQVNLSGEIKDQTGYSIMGANIIAVNNETQILDGFGISNENGYFSLNLKKDTEFNIKITFIGYKPIEFNISLSEDLIKDFVLEEQAEALDEVELVYEMPVEIKGDTIVYSADAFNTGTEKKLSDVLAILPVIEAFKLNLPSIIGADNPGVFFSKIKPLILPLCALDFAHMIKTSAIGLFEIHDFSPEIL